MGSGSPLLIAELEYRYRMLVFVWSLAALYQATATIDFPDPVPSYAVTTPKPNLSITAMYHTGCGAYAHLLFFCLRPSSPVVLIQVRC